MSEIIVSGTVVDLPESSAAPNWSTAIIEALTLLATSLSGAVGNYDIAPQVLDINAFNTSTNENVIGLSFPTATVRSAVITYYVYRTASGPVSASESGQILIDYNPARSSNEKWAIQRECVGDGLIDFNITDTGQVQFTTSALGSSHVGSIGFSAKALQNS